MSSPPYVWIPVGLVALLALIGHQQVTSGLEQPAAAAAAADDPCKVVRCTSGTRCRAFEGRAHCCPLVCTKIYKPVCGSDGKTYDNECVLRRAACEHEEPIVQVSEGQCEGGIEDANSRRDCDIMCTADYRPVCGTDGKTYSNSCQLRVAACRQNDDQLAVAHEGKCYSSHCNSSDDDYYY